MNISLSDHFNFNKLIRFTLPSIAMMVFSSIYGVVDGYYISNYTGAVPFAGVTLIMPFIYILGSIGFMFGSGGSALVSMTLGQGHTKRAREIFSLLIYTLIATGIVLAILGAILAEPVALLLGASPEMVPYCVAYVRIGMLTLTFFMLQNVFQSFFVTAELPIMGFIITVAAGVTNMVLDWLFVGVLHYGVNGAAAATCLSECVGGLVPLVYFFRARGGTLYLVKTRFRLQPLIATCINGISEFMTNISSSIVSMVYVIQLMKIAGENGVAAYGVIMYINYFFLGIFIGYAFGSAPIIGFHFGAKNYDELKNLRIKSLLLITIFSISIFALAELFCGALARFYVGYDASLLEVTMHGLRICCLSFLFCGFNIFCSSFFTALNNGPVSALLSFSRTLVFQLLCLLLLPLLWGIDGIWCAIVAAELLSLIVSFICMHVFRKRYHY
ncbi:MAG: oligosaccharide flippase family protein [Lachnospiraceae bacterium]|nr:oligosaccharide flippase family protein [Lachnospiraceae bacterium]